MASDNIVEPIMSRLSNSQIDILALAADAQQGPALPAPTAIASDVSGLLYQGLLAAVDNRIQITEAGRAALEEQRERVL